MKCSSCQRELGDQSLLDHKQVCPGPLASKPKQKGRRWIWVALTLLISGAIIWLVVTHSIRSTSGPPETIFATVTASQETQGACNRLLDRAEADAGFRVNGIGYSNPDAERVVHRKDYRDGQDPIMWDLQMPASGYNATHKEADLLTSDVIHVSISNHTNTVVLPEVVAFFWKDGGDVLMVRTIWIGSHDSDSEDQLVLKPAEKLLLALDSDGYSPLLVMNGQHDSSLHLTLLVHFANVPDFACQTDLPKDLIQRGQHLDLEFRDVARHPDVERMAKVDVKTADWPAVAWGPPALRRYEGGERSEYTFFKP